MRTINCANAAAISIIIVGWPATGWFCWPGTCFPTDKPDLEHKRQERDKRTANNYIGYNLMSKVVVSPLIVYILCFQCINCVPCSPPRAAHSHSSSVGSLLSFHRQKAWASFQLTWTTGKLRRSRMPEPGPAGWAVGQRSERQTTEGMLGDIPQTMEKIQGTTHLSPKHTFYRQPPRSRLHGRDGKMSQKLKLLTRQLLSIKCITIVYGMCSK